MTAHLWNAIRDETEATRLAVSALTDAQDLAEAHEELAEQERRARLALEKLSAAKRECTARLESALGDGEAVVAPSGRVAYLGPRSGGASVRTQAVDDLAFDLPPDLHPQETTRYPGVGEVRAAYREGRITREQRDLLLEEGAPRMGLRWRTLAAEWAGA